MGRPSRRDFCGAWHHVVNRGLAKRPVFENRRDIRQFLSLVARAARRGDLEVHAYTFLTTHFHLLVRSPRGALSEAMRRIENPYVRHFNRLRMRDGPLFRGRFYSRLVETRSYWRTLIRYIDQNAVAAGLAPRGVDYPHGSAFRYSRGAGPIWLTRHVIESEVCASLGAATYQPHDYEVVFGDPIRPGLDWVVRRRMEQSRVSEDPLDDLLGAAPSAVREWLSRKARLADCTVPVQPVLEPRVVQRWIEEHRDSENSVGPRIWRILANGLFRQLCGLTVKEISLRLDAGLATTNRDLADHVVLQQRDASYLDLATRCVSDVLSWAYTGLAENGKFDPDTVRISPARTGAWRRPRRG